VHVFDDEAEQEAKERLKNGNGTAGVKGAHAGGAIGTARKRVAWTPEQKKKGFEEAKRLLQGRKELPVFGGTFPLRMPASESEWCSFTAA
jgi:hypothetical protein